MILNIAYIQNVPFNDHRMVHTDGIAREMIKRGHSVDVVIQRGDHGSRFEEAPYNIVEVSGGTYSVVGQMLFMFSVFFLLRDKDYDVIHAKNPFSSVLPALMCKRGSKIIYDMRGLWIDFGVHSGNVPSYMASLLWRIDLWCMKKADKVIAISHELKKELIKKGIKSEHIQVIVGDGVAFEEIQRLEPKNIRDYLGIKGKIVGYVGGIGRSRFSEKIVEAFKYVHEKKESVNLVMIGPCKEIEYFTKLINKLGLNNNVFFLGYMPHDICLKFMKSFDVAVSYHECDFPFFNVAVPTKILEYCACGCSIVATNQKMYENILTHKKNGYLTVQNPKSFAEGISLILHNKNISDFISINARKLIKNYSFKEISLKLNSLYVN